MGQYEDVIKMLAKKSLDNTETINELREQVAQLMKSLRSYDKAIRGGLFNERGPGGRRCTVFRDAEQAKAFGKFVIEAMNQKLTEGVNTDGGFTVPDQFVIELISLLPNYGKFRKNARVLPINAPLALVPRITTDIEVYSPGEAKQGTGSSPTFGQVQIKPQTLIALCLLSNELIDDAFAAIGEIVGISMVRSLAKKEDLAGFLGDGTSTYFGLKGILGAFAAIDASPANVAGLHVGTGNDYSELVLDDFREVISLLPEDFDEGAKWYCSKRFFFSTMWRLAESAGAAGLYEILSNKKAHHFLGYEVEFVGVMPGVAANSQIPCILGDLGMGAYLSERQHLSIQRSTDAYFGSNQTAMRAVERIDTTVFGCGDATNPGPIVGLAMAAG